MQATDVAQHFGVRPHFIVNVASEGGLGTCIRYSGLQALLEQRPPKPQSRALFRHTEIAEFARRNPHLTLRQIAQQCACSREMARYVLKREGVKLISHTKVVKQAAALMLVPR